MPFPPVFGCIETEVLLEKGTQAGIWKYLFHRRRDKGLKKLSNNLLNQVMRLDRCGRVNKRLLP